MSASIMNVSGPTPSFLGGQHIGYKVVVKYSINNETAIFFLYSDEEKWVRRHGSVYNAAVVYSNEMKRQMIAQHTK